jgi:hypothetical protein
MQRHGYEEETYYTFSYSPISNNDGSAGGIICANTDDTQRVIGERQLALLRNLAATTGEARTWRQACERSAQALSTNLYDLPFAAIYTEDVGGRALSLTASSGIARGHHALPPVVSLDRSGVWPVFRGASKNGSASYRRDEDWKQSTDGCVESMPFAGRCHPNPGHR